MVLSEDGRHWRRPALYAEYDVFLRHLPEWLVNHSGMFVLIKGENVLGFFTKNSEALAAGISMFSSGPFFVHRIEPRSVLQLA